MLIGLTGYAGVGKDTYADALARVVHPDQFRRVAFADALRAEVAHGFQIPNFYFMMHFSPEGKNKDHQRFSLSNCRNQHFVKLMLKLYFEHDVESDFTRKEQIQFFLDEPRSPRWVMQQWGTEYRRARQENYWVVRLRTHLAINRNSSFLTGKLTVITDVRFRNEVDFIHKYGGQVLQITREGFGPVNSHSSDTQITALDIDHCVENTGQWLVPRPTEEERGVLA